MSAYPDGPGQAIVEVRRWQRQGQQTAQWQEEDLEKEGWRTLGTYQDVSDPENGKAQLLGIGGYNTKTSYVALPWQVKPSRLTP